MAGATVPKTPIKVETEAQSLKASDQPDVDEDRTATISKLRSALKVMSKSVSMSQTQTTCIRLGETPRVNHVAESPFCLPVYLLAIPRGAM